MLWYEGRSNEVGDLPYRTYSWLQGDGYIALTFHTEESGHPQKLSFACSNDCHNLKACADDQAPPDRKTRWLATFYLCIPTGYAVGYIFGGVVAQWTGWRGPFLLEALLMTPFVLYCMAAPPLDIKGSKSGPPHFADPLFDRLHCCPNFDTPPMETLKPFGSSKWHCCLQKTYRFTMKAQYTCCSKNQRTKQQCSR